MKNHGVGGYTTDKCRCGECVTAWKAYQSEWRSKLLSSPDVEHGKRVTYLSGCRCQGCRQANAAYALRRRKRLAESTSEDEVPHGSSGYAQYGCRCDVCTRAKATETRDHYVRNADYFAEKARGYCYRKRSQARLVTDRDIRRLLDRYGRRCAYCGADGKLEMDHVIPLHRGGRHSIGNLVPACVRCNRSKSDRLLIDWRLRA